MCSVAYPFFKTDTDKGKVKVKIRMNWYSKLYIGEGAKPKAGKIIRKLKRNAGQVDIYLITLASNGQDMLDIINSAYLKQPAVRRSLPMIVGIAKGYEEALDLVEQMLMETHRETGGYRIVEYLLQQAGQDCKNRQQRE